MTFDHEVTLISQTFTEDSIGNQIPVEIGTVVLCAKKAVGRREFYNAAGTGLRPELVLVINAYEYSGEGVVEFEGTRYSVIRTYEANSEEVELTCEKVNG